jgi:hypothetical protein
MKSLFQFDGEILEIIGRRQKLRNILRNQEISLEIKKYP